MKPRNLFTPKERAWNEFYKVALARFPEASVTNLPLRQSSNFYRRDITSEHRVKPYTLSFLVPEDKSSPPLLEIEEFDLTQHDVDVLSDCGISRFPQETNWNFLGSALYKISQLIRLQGQRELTDLQSQYLCFSIEMEPPADFDEFVRQIDGIANRIEDHAAVSRYNHQPRPSPQVFVPRRLFTPRNQGGDAELNPSESSGQILFNPSNSTLPFADFKQQHHQTSSQFTSGHIRASDGDSSRLHLPPTESCVAGGGAARQGFVVRSRSSGYNPIPDDPSKFEFARDESINLVTSSSGADAKHEIWLSAKARSMLFAHIGWGDLGRTDNKNEQGGILLGEVIVTPDGRTIGLVYEAIPGQRGRGNPSYLELDTATWIDMYKAVDRIRETAYQCRPPDRPLVIVGWYHTHPNSLGIFMSGTDQATQRQMFAKNWQFAIIFNPQRCYWGAFYGGDSRPCLGWLEKDLSDGEVPEPFAPEISLTALPTSNLLSESSDEVPLEQRISASPPKIGQSLFLLAISLLSLITISATIILWIRELNRSAKISDINSLLGGENIVLRDGIIEQDEKIRQLAERGEGLEVVKSNLTSLNSRLDSESSSLSALRGQIDEIKASLSVIQSEISKNRSQLSDAIADLKSVEKIEKATISGVTSAQTELDALANAKVGKMQGDKDDAKGSTTNTEIPSNSDRSFSQLAFAPMVAGTLPQNTTCSLCIVKNITVAMSEEGFHERFVADFVSELTKLLKGRKNYKISLISKPDSVKAIFLEKIKTIGNQNLGSIEQISRREALNFGFKDDLDNDSLGIFVVVSDADK